MKSSAKPPRCPICRAEVIDSPAPPFCSERCRTIDLGNWLGESYRIPVVDETPADESSSTDDEH